MYMAVALLVWVAWIINPNSLHYMSPDFIGGFFLPYCEFTFLLISCGKSLPMKFLLLLLYSLSNGFLKAQECRDHLLMQKWVQQIAPVVPGVQSRKEDLVLAAPGSIIKERLYCNVTVSTCFFHMTSFLPILYIQEIFFH